LISIQIAYYLFKIYKLNMEHKMNALMGGSNYIENDGQDGM